MLIIIHVNGVPSVGVTAGELVHVASELIIADDFVQRVAIRVRIVGAEPVGVLVDNGTPPELIDVRV